MNKESTVQETEDTDRELQTQAKLRATSPFEEMERMFDPFFRRGWIQPFQWEWPSWREPAAPFSGRMPRVDVIDRDDEILIRAEIPGVEKKDLEVSVTDNTVTLRGSTRREEKEEEGEYYRRELTQGSFSRTVALPAEVDGDKANATFKDGMLEVKAPKVTKSRRRTIQVD